MANEVKLGITAEDTGLQAGLTAATASLAEFSETTKASIEGVAGAFEKMAGVFAIATAALAGGEMFKEAVASTVNLNTASIALGKQFGISATEASALKVALGSVFVSQDTLAAAGAKITQTLKSNEGAFADLGVATRDSTGNFRGQLDIMTDVNAKLMSFKEGTDRNVEGAKIYGKAWQEVSDVLKLTPAVMEEARIKAEQLGLMVGQESVAQTKAYRSAMNDVHEVMEGVSVAIGNALLPALTSMGQWISDNGVNIINGFKAAIYSVTAAFSFFKEGVTVATDWIAGKISILGAEFDRLADVALAVKNGANWAEVKAAWAEGTANIEAASKQMYTAMADDMAAAEQARAKFFDQMAGNQTAIKKPAGGATSDGGAGKDELDSLIKELSAEEAALNKHHQAEMERYKQDEAEFSKAAGARIAIAEEEVAAELRTYGESSPQYEKAQLHLVEVKRQANAQLIQMGDAFEKTSTQQQLASIAADEKAMQTKFQHGEVSNAQLLAGLLAFENQRTAIAEAGIRQRESLIDPKTDPVQYAQLQAQIEALEMAHQQKMSEIKAQAAQKDQQVWDQVNKNIQQSFTSSVSGMLTGTTTLTKGIQSLWQGAVKSIVGAFADMAAKWLIMQVQNMAATKAAAAGQISASIGIAGAAGTASFAAAPWPIDMGAAAFGAAMAADAASFGAVASAAGGMDVPNVRELPATLHAKEMVLPESLAERVRAMTTPAAGAGAGSSGPTHINFPGKSFGNMFMMHQDDLVDAIRQSHRDGKFGKFGG
jgi:hypothetical protein